MFKRERERHKFRVSLRHHITKPSKKFPANHEMHCVKQESNRNENGNSYEEDNLPAHRIEVVSGWNELQIYPANLSGKRWILIVHMLIICAAIGSHLSKPTEASLIIGDSAIEIQEVDSGSADNQQQQQQQQQQHPPVANQQNAQQSNSNNDHQSVILDSTSGSSNAQQSVPSNLITASPNSGKQARIPTGPLPPLTVEDVTDGDQKSRGNHDYDMSDLGHHEGGNPEKGAINEVMSVKPSDLKDDGKTIAGKVVDFELTPAGGHNKAKIKKKMKKKAKKNMEKSFKQWGKKKKAEKKAMDMEEKKGMKKKKEEGKKAKKKWGHEEHGQKKKGKFKKKKWGSQLKKGKGVKKGKKGKKFLKDVGHKNTGFKTVYHKEEWGKSSKWHDIKREKKWDEKSKKWKDKWKKEKGKKYKGDHMKKFEAQKKAGKKYKKEKKDKFKKSEKEKFAAGKKMKKEEHKKKKEGGAKKEMSEMKKKKKKKKP